MDQSGPENGPPLEAFREYLMLLARLQLRRYGLGVLDPSDLVQQTMLKGYQFRGQFRGQNDGQLAAWLRAILAREMADAARKHDRRGEGRLLSLQSALEESSMRLERRLLADSTSPGDRAARQEQLLNLVRSLVHLPDAQRLALELHHIEGLPVGEVGRRMGRSTAAVAGLLRRGLAALREALGADSRED
jgi:RNA polymerase sigma-70 factor (subfamily 1)